MMRAIVAKEQNVLSYSNNADIPECGRAELLVKVDTACICNGSDPAILSGSTRLKFPCIFGHEGCGRIVRTGEDTKGFQTGDRVAWWFTMGAFAEYVCVNPETTAVIRIPSNEIGSVRELGEKAVTLYQEGKLNLSGLVTDIIKLKEVPEYLKLLEREPEKHIKIIVKIS